VKHRRISLRQATTLKVFAERRFSSFLNFTPVGGIVETD